MELSNSTRRGGFTVIEALVVIAIIGITAMFALPAVGRTVANTRVQRASTVIATDIRTAFSIAAQQRRPVRIVIDEGQRVFRIQNRQADTTYLETWYDGSTDLVVRQLSAQPDSMLIFPSGLAAGGMVVNMETTPANQRVVTANRAGQVRITQP